MLSFDEYQVLQQRTANKRGGITVRLLNGALGISDEAGEVAGLVKKNQFQGHDLDPGKMQEELGDVLWYLSEVASAIGISLDDVATGNIAKLKKRYPDGFSEQKSRNRNEP